MNEAQRPLILVTNDDGYHAKGIHSLVEVMEEFGEVIVVAPSLPQSGMGHAITINAPLRLQELKDFNGVRAYGSSGTPVDCVKLGIYGILKRKPDLIVSGINHGANFSINVLYSGTMSAAVEGALENIPSIGFSLLDHSPDADFTLAKQVVRKVVKESLEKGVPHHTCLNVNIPAVAESEYKGIKVCRQGVGHWQDEFIERSDPSGKPYFWISGSFNNLDKGEDTDTWALKHGYVSIVPVQFDMTAHQEMATINSWDL